MNDEIVWQDPPEPKESRATELAKALRSRPGEWAMIEQHTNVFIFYWWAPLRRDLGFEIKEVQSDSTIFGPRDIYARWNPSED